MTSIDRRGSSAAGRAPRCHPAAASPWGAAAQAEQRRMADARPSATRRSTTGRIWPNSPTAPLPRREHGIGLEEDHLEEAEVQHPLHGGTGATTAQELGDLSGHPRRRGLVQLLAVMRDGLRVSPARCRSLPRRPANSQARSMRTGSSWNRTPGSPMARTSLRLEVRRSLPLQSITE